jgi:hypothetical protein
MKKTIKKAQQGINVEPKKYNREEFLRSINSMPKTTPAQDSADKARHDSLQKVNRPTWLKAVDDNNMELAPTKKPAVKQKNGGKTPKAKDGKWIQKAVNPAHKGYCTPMTKATCTPKRKALAQTFKAIGKARKSK